MKSFYSNLLSGAFLLSTVVLSSPAQAGGGSPNWAEDAITTVAAQQHQVQAKDLNEPIPFKVKDMLIQMGAIDDYESEINVGTLWKTTPEFITEFTNKFQERLNVKALLRFSYINEETTVLETLLKVGKRYRDSNISDTLQNILALTANPRGHHSHLFLNFANLSGLDLIGAKLTSSDLKKAKLIETNLTGAIITSKEKANYASRGAIVGQ